MLQDVALICCECLARPLSISLSRKERIETTKYRVTTTVAILISNRFQFFVFITRLQDFNCSFCFLAEPSAPPANVSGHNTSSTSIFVHWDQVPTEHQNGAILYYTVTYIALPRGLRQTVIVAAPANQTTLTGLNKYTNYSISVFASTIKGAGNVSAPIFIVTDEDSK